MPWSILKDDRCPASKPYGVVKDDDNELEGCHPSQEAAKKQQAALYANEGRSMTERPPRENLARAIFPGVEVRSQDDEAGPPILAGHFSMFNNWYEVDSLFEGHFLERTLPGAFKRTFNNNRSEIRALFQHGQDPQIGDKVLGPIEVLEEDAKGARYEVPLLDTSYNRDLIPGLKAGLYGSSFRFSVVQEDWDDHAPKAPHNPKGLPERSISEAKVYEFGPVTFPASPSATAGVRSMTDFVRDPEHSTLPMRADALPLDGPEAAPHSDEGTREAPTPAGVTVDPPPPQQETRTMSDVESENMTVEERAARQTDIKSRLATIDKEYADSEFPAAVQDEWEKLNAEHDHNERVLKVVAERRARMAAINREAGPESREGGHNELPTIIRKPGIGDIYDLTAIRNQSRTAEDEKRLLKDNARRAIEIARFPGAKDRSAAQAHVEWILDNVVEDRPGEFSRRLLTTGRPLYDQAFGKALAGAPLDNDESRALSLTAGAGGNAVTFDLDPTIMGTGARGVSPWRTISRVIPITGDEWRGVTSGAITTAYDTEAAETTDNAPTLTQPAISTEKAQAFVPFSIEIDMDWAGMRGEMSQLLQESKDDLEAVKFATGTGTNEPFGVITGATTTVNATTGQTTDAEDFYRLTAALPERYQPRASIVANRAIFNLIRQFVLTGQSNPWKDIDEATVTDGRAGMLLGYPAYQSSAMAAVTTTGSLFAIIGDFSRFVIVDRVGLNVEVLPHLLGANRRPTGQRGLYAFWRNGSKVINADAFRVLIGIA